MICGKTMRECTTPSMCSPYGGCGTSHLVFGGRRQEDIIEIVKLLTDGLQVLAYHEPEMARTWGLDDILKNLHERIETLEEK